MSETPPPQPLLIGTRDAARLLSVCEKTIDNLRKREGLPSVKLGDRRLYDPDLLRRWVNQRFAAEGVSE